MADKIPEEDLEWQPPTEAEKKIIQARRERNDKISKLMGDYLLKGYKMLGTNCPSCTTILLRSKQGQDYCVACNELDSDADKDNPATNAEAARSQVEEHQRSVKHMVQDTGTGMSPGVTVPVESTSDSLMVQQVTDNPEVQVLETDALNQDSLGAYLRAIKTAIETEQQNVPEAEDSPNKGSVQYASHALNRKITWAADELDKTQSIEYSIQLCQLMKSAAEAYKFLKQC